MTLRPRALLLLPPLALALAAAGCGRAPSVESTAKAATDSSPPLAVRVVTTQQVKVPRILTLSGSLTGAEEAQVAAGAVGKVVATYVERGSVVRKGAVLAKLDARALDAQAQEAAAQLASLKAQQAQSVLDCQRTEQMFHKGAISKADYDRQKTACETTRFSVSAAEARRTLTAEALNDTEIRAPFSGMVVERFVTAGEYVRADSRVVTLVDTDSLRVELTVPEADVVQVKKGMSVDFQTAASENVVHGKVRYIGPSVRRQTRDAVVEAVVDNAGHDLRPGMFVTATLALGEQTLPAVPKSAVRAEGTLRHVFLVDAGRLEDRLVQVSEPLQGLVPVVNGLKVGDRVVSEVTPDVRDGARVQ
jgi:membrane fusion protein (multidrug efflux system)